MEAPVLEAGKPLCAKVDGFSLHAARRVEAADREGLERLCRYGLRSPLSLERLGLDPDGQVRSPLDEAGLFANEPPDDNGDDWTYQEEGSQIARAPP